VTEFGDEVVFSTASDITFLRVGASTVNGTTAESITTGGVRLNRTAERLNAMWWEVKFILTTPGPDIVSADVAYGMAFPMDWAGVKWKFRRIRGPIAANCLNDLYNITFILHNTSVVNPVSGWYISYGSSVITATNMWPSITDTTPFSRTGYTGINFNWQNIPVYPGSQVTLKFLAGHGPVPQIDDLAEPTASPAATPTPAKTPTISRSRSHSRTITFSKTPSPTVSPSPEATLPPTPTITISLEASSTPDPTVSLSPEATLAPHATVTSSREASSSPDPTVSLSPEATFTPHATVTISPEASSSPDATVTISQTPSLSPESTIPPTPNPSLSPDPTGTLPLTTAPTPSLSPDSTIPSTPDPSSTPDASISSVPVATLTDLAETSESVSNGKDENAESLRQPIAKSGTSVIGYFSAIGLLLIANMVLLFSDLRCNPSPYVEDLSDSESDSN
jgi:hypothetical protein